MNRPDLSGAKIIGLDIETFDPQLKELGPGVYRRDGYMLGFSVSVDGFTEYYNVGHDDCTREDKEANLAYLRDICGNNVPKVGANFRYDLDWIGNAYGTNVRGKLYDVQVAEPLLDAYRGTYALDSLAKSYLGRGKIDEIPQQWCDSHNLKGDFRQHLYMMPYELVRQYAIGDADETRLILDKQLVKLEEEGLTSLFEMECSLIRPLLEMRKIGVRIDTKKRDENAAYIRSKLAEVEKKLVNEYGLESARSTKQCAEAFKRAGIISTPDPESGKISYDKKSLARIQHPLVTLITQARELQQALSLFFDSSFVDTVVDGRIHGEFVPNHQDDGGTVTGRFSGRNPNLQQIASTDRDKARTEHIGKMCRELFLPEEDCDYLKIDYSQIEYRVMTHFATGPKAEEMRNEYRNNPKTDFHEMARQWAYNQTGVELSRSRAKNLGFGVAYFMGVRSMANFFNWSLEEAKSLSQVYFETFPFLVPTRDDVVATAKARGYVRTPLGRRARVSSEMRRTGKEFKVWNYLVQGTAADILKSSLCNIYESGLMDTLKIHLTVHDEFGVSIPRTKEGYEAALELKHLMETSIPLDVPLIAEPEIGPNWGSVSEELWNDRLKEFNLEAK